MRFFRRSKPVEPAAPPVGADDFIVNQTHHIGIDSRGRATRVRSTFERVGTNLTGLSLEPDSTFGDVYAEFGDVEVDVIDLSIRVPEHYFSSLAVVETLATNVERAIAWVKREQTRRAGGAA